MSTEGHQYRDMIWLLETTEEWRSSFSNSLNNSANLTKGRKDAVQGRKNLDPLINFGPLFQIQLLPPDPLPPVLTSQT